MTDADRNPIADGAWLSWEESIALVHSCPLPYDDVRAHATGEVWKCVCGRCWVLTEKSPSGASWEQVHPTSRGDDLIDALRRVLGR